MMKISFGRKHRKLKITVLVVTLLFLSLSLYTPVRTVKGLVTNTGIPLPFNNISIDAGRIATLSTSQSAVTVYDIASGRSVSFACPPTGTTCFMPVVNGNRIVMLANTTLLIGKIFYCELPRSSTLQACGPWEVVATGVPGLAYCASWGCPMSHGDLVVWPVNPNGVAYWRFSTNQTTTIPTPGMQPVSVSTNGQIIAFIAKPSGSSSLHMMYVDTSEPGQGVIDTGLPSGEYSTSVFQEIIAFTDNSTGTPNRLRYFNTLTGQASPAGTGPIGTMAPTYEATPAINGDRIVFIVDEVTDGFDCNGDGTLSSGQYCLGYWNYRAPSYIATTLNATAAPPLTVYPAISGNIIAFKGTDGNLQYATVPMKGDVNQDGVVDGNDKNIVQSCIGKLLKGSIC